MVESKSFGSRLFDVLNYALLFVLTVVFLYPLWYVLVGSISDPVRLFMHNGLLWRPLGFSLHGYRTMLQNPNVGIGYANTIFYVVVGTVLSIFFSCLGAYTLSRPKLMFKKLFTLLVVFTMYFSGGMIPKFLVVKGVGLYNTRMAVILPGVISTWNMIVMRTSFRAIPQSLEESARLDGAGDFTILFRIIVPCAKATIAVMVLYYAVAQWNGWFDAMIYLQDRSKFPLQLFLREILLININNANNAAGNDAADVLYLDTLVKYAMIIISTVLILCIYPFVQKYFMKGVMMGSIKE
ncbi:MAG: carbohydrate ABC transporter permease [Clostridiales bacterium]|nr:carbohydrate ABC transporter permease [Clostridiales bacterium]MDY5468918.1 carbohydrate ABC transporter permease [Eubacteriales bacterium]